MSSEIKVNSIQDKTGTRTLASDSGSAWSWGSSVPKGSVIEQFASPCDGSSITVQSGTYTVTNVTSAQTLTQSYGVINGGSLTYTPPTGTQTVIYNFGFLFGRDDDSRTILHLRLYIDGTEVTNFRKTYSFQSTSNPEMYTNVSWPFNIGGSTTDATGRQATWTSGKAIVLQGRSYNTSFDCKLFNNILWDGSDLQNVFSQPVIGITALA